GLSHAGRAGVWGRSPQRGDTGAEPPCVGLLVAIDDTTAGQVVRAELNHDPVLGEDPDVVLTHLARDVREYLVAVAQLHTEHRVGQRFDNAALDLDDAVFLGHILASPDGGRCAV